MPTLDELKSSQVLTAVPSANDLIPFIDVDEVGNSVVKKSLVSSIGGVSGNGTGITDAGAFRSVLGSPADYDLADFARGQHHLPLAVSRVRLVGMFPATNTPALSVLGWGDSLGVSYSTLVGSTANISLIRGVPFMGYKLMATDMYTVIGVGSATLTFGADWLTNQYIAQAASTTLQWARTGNIPCNRISIAYLRGTGSSTVTLQYSQNGGSSWTTSATIDTSAAANEFNFAIYSLPGARPTLVRTVTAAGHTIKLIGTGAWQGEEGAFAGNSGYTMICGARGGLETADIIRPSATMWATLMVAAKVDMVISSWNERAEDWDEGGAIEAARARADAGRVSDWVMVSGVSGDSATPGAPDAIDMRNQRVAMRAWALRENQNFIDWAGFLRDSWDYAVSIGIHSSGDSIHPTTYGYSVRQAYVADQLGRVLNASNDFVGNIATDLGNGYRLRANQYGILLESLEGFTSGLTISGPSAYLNLESATDTDPWRNLSFSYTGSESAGLTFGWTSYRQEGAGPYNILRFTAISNSGASNLETLSDYPLVITTKKVNAEPLTPAANTIKEYWHLNGTPKWEKRVKLPSGTVHILWTEP